MKTVDSATAMKISSLEDFLIYKRETSIDFGKRLLFPFRVVNFSSNPKESSLLVELEGNNSASADSYWVDKKELEKFLKGDKKTGVNLVIDREYYEGGKLTFEVSMPKNGFKKPTIIDAQRLKGIKIVRNNQLYKSYDVQVKPSGDNYMDKTIIDNTVRVFVMESSSAESFILKNIILRNKVQMQGPIRMETQETEEFVSKHDALKAIKMEKESVINELRSWFTSSLANNLSEDIAEAFLRRLNEL